jgi:peptidoglycan hydrolase-like protein with peptidoglycan-binding domain
VAAHSTIEVDRTPTKVAHPAIKLGSKGSAVRLAQRRLAMRWYDPGPVDGKFGAKTQKAVKYYQLDRDLDADGVIGSATWTRLDPPTIKSGASGDVVRLLQTLLERYEYEPFDPGPVDGEFGPSTRKAVRHFQEEMSLEVDGIVGFETWAMLGS